MIVTDEAAYATIAAQKSAREAKTARLCAARGERGPKSLLNLRQAKRPPRESGNQSKLDALSCVAEWVRFTRDEFRTTSLRLDSCRECFGTAGNGRRSVVVPRRMIIMAPLGGLSHKKVPRR